jgi:hypothetical protein
MRSGVKIRQKGDAQGMPPSWPAVDLEMKATNNVPLCAADLREPPLLAKLVAKRWAHNRPSQATSCPGPGNFSQMLLHHLMVDCAQNPAFLGRRGCSSGNASPASTITRWRLLPIGLRSRPSRGTRSRYLKTRGGEELDGVALKGCSSTTSETTVKIQRRNI